MRPHSINLIVLVSGRLGFCFSTSVVSVGSANMFFQKSGSKSKVEVNLIVHLNRYEMI